MKAVFLEPALQKQLSDVGPDTLPPNPWVYCETDLTLAVPVAVDLQLADPDNAFVVALGQPDVPTPRVFRQLPQSDGLCQELRRLLRRVRTPDLKTAHVEV